MILQQKKFLSYFKISQRAGIITLLVTGFSGLAYESISSYLHNKRQTALKKVFVATENQVNLERNKNFSFIRFNGNLRHLQFTH